VRAGWTPLFRDPVWTVLAGPRVTVARLEQP